MKGVKAIIVCAIALTLTIGYFTMTHKAQSSRMLLEIVTELNTVKRKISQLIKNSKITGKSTQSNINNIARNKIGEKIESSLAGDLKNIERKMEKISTETVSSNVPSLKSSKLSNIQGLDKVGPESINESSLLSNDIVDQLIENYLREKTIPINRISQIITEKPELLSIVPKLLQEKKKPIEYSSIRVSEIPTTLMKNIIDQQMSTAANTNTSAISNNRMLPLTTEVKTYPKNISKNSLIKNLDKKNGLSTNQIIKNIASNANYKLNKKKLPVVNRNILKKKLAITSRKIPDRYRLSNDSFNNKVPESINKLINNKKQNTSRIMASSNLKNILRKKPSAINKQILMNSRVNTDGYIANNIELINSANKSQNTFKQKEEKQPEVAAESAVKVKVEEEEEEVEEEEEAYETADEIGKESINNEMPISNEMPINNEKMPTNNEMPISNEVHINKKVSISKKAPSVKTSNSKNPSISKTKTI